MKVRSLYSVNIELTNKCPLHCPQCYCSLEGNKHIDLEIAKLKIKEAAEHGVQTVNLSGGETLCYPWLYELISYASGLCKQVNIAISGCFFSEEVLQKLLDTGVTSVSVSLNGSTKEINSLTRDGYELAIKALEILGRSKLEQTYINWVMHTNNCDDFQNVVTIAEKYNIHYIDVIMFKPDARHELKTFPSGKQMKQIANYIHFYKGPVRILVESCFSPLLALVSNYSWTGNINTGIQKGCGAGMYMYNISVDGLYSPCRHLDFCEDYPTLDDYLEKSAYVKKVAGFEENLRHPCSVCSLEKFCRPCPAIPIKLYDDVFKGHEPCEIWKLNMSPFPHRN